MSWHFTSNSFALIFTAALAFYIAYTVWRGRRMPGSIPLMLLMIAVAEWSLTAAFELAAVEVWQKIFWAKLEYIGILSIPVLFLIFALQYSGRDSFTTKSFIGLLWVIPIISILLVFTNELHSLIWKDISQVPSNPINNLVYDHGLWFWLLLVYCYLCLIFGSILLVWSISTIHHLHWGQTIAILSAVAIPWLGNLFYISGLIPIKGLDITPFTFTISGLILAIAIKRFQLFDITPIARSKLLDSLADAFLVLDRQNTVVDLNTAARKLFNKNDNQIIGKQASQVLGTWSQLLEINNRTIESSDAENPIQGPNGNWYSVKVSPLNKNQEVESGRLVVIQDISQAVETQNTLSKQAKDLQTVAKISVAIASTMEIKQLLQDVVELTKSNFELYYAQVFLVNSNRDALNLASGAGDIGQKVLSIGLQVPIGQEHSIVAQAARTNKVVVVDDIQQNPAFKLQKFLPETRSEAAIPITIGDELLGILDIQDKTANRFTSTYLNIFTTLAAQIAVTIQNASIFDQLNDRKIQLQETMQIAKMGGFEYDPCTYTVDLTDELLELFGTSVHLEGGRQLNFNIFIEKFFHPEDAIRIRDDLEKKLISGTHPSVERAYRFIKNEEVRYGLGRIVLERDEHNNPYKIRGTIQDITEIEQAQTNAARLATVIEQAHEVVVITDVQGDIIYVNPEFEKLTGYSSEEVVGKNPNILKSGQQTVEFYEELWFTIKKGDPWQGIFINKRKDGTHYHEAATIFPIKNQAGETLNYAAVKRDISAQVKAEKDLKERERFLQVLNNITRASLEQTDFQTLLQILADRLGELMDADGCYITEWDEYKHTVLPGAAFGPKRDDYRSILPPPDEISLTESVLTAGHPIAVEDVSNSVFISPKIASMFPMKSIIGLPLIANEQKLGAALISFENHHIFSPAEISRGEQAASLIALAIAKARALETAQRRFREAENLRQASAAVASTLYQDETIELILEKLNDVIPYDSASVQLIKDGDLEIVGGRGFSDLSQVIGIRFPVIGENPSAIVFSNRKSYILDDAPLEYKIFHQPPHNQIRGWMGVPIILKDRLIGVISLDSYKPGTFNEGHSKLASAFADQVAVALENARLYQDALYNAERSDILRHAIQNISSAILVPEDLYSAIYSAISSLMPVDSFIISIYDEPLKKVHQVFLKDKDKRWPSRTLETDHCLEGHIINNPQGLLIGNFDNYPEFKKKTNYFDSDEYVRSGIAVPMFYGKNVVGVLFAQSHKAGVYTQEDLVSFELIAAPAGVALKNAILYAEVHRLANVDPLTSLNNRRRFFELAHLEFERARRYKHPLSAIMLDIDHFKLINDTFGHSVGDVVLEEIAKICQNATRKADVIGRYGGEEFIIILPETGVGKAQQAAERLRADIEKTPIETDRGTLSLTVSLGVHTLAAEPFRQDAPMSELEKLIDRADQALYDAKQSGRNQVKVWKTDLEKAGYNA